MRAFLAIVAILFLVACNEEKPPARTVDYFLAHPAELEGKLRQCRTDPGTLHSDPECVNADEAQRRLRAQKSQEWLNQNFGGSGRK